jgi:hypothetical protein
VSGGGHADLVASAEVLATIVYRAFPGRGWTTRTETQGANADLVRSWSPVQRRVAALRVHHDAVASATPSSAFGQALELLDDGIAWTRADLVWSLDRLTHERGLWDGEAFRLPARIAVALASSELDGLVPALRAVVEDLLHRDLAVPARRELVDLFAAAIDRATGDPVPTRLLHSGDDFGPAARKELAAVLAAPGVRDALEHAATLNKLVPSRRWLTIATALCPPAADAVRALLELFAAEPRALHQDTDDLLRGLTYLQASDPSAATTDLIARVARAAAEAPPRAAGYPYAPKTANAACLILPDRDGDASARTLATLSLTVRNKALAARVREALERLGERRGWQPGEALELAVEDHGLDAGGRRGWAHDDYAIILELTEDKPRLRYEHAGEATASVPTGVRDTPVLAAAKVEQKRLAAAVVGERGRLEGLLAQDRVWSLADWRVRYLGHPVTAGYARRLVWEISTDRLMWTAAVPCLDPDAFARSDGSVRLWHPLSVDPSETAVWRDRLTAGGVRQPFKQAFREAYGITPAEVTAGDASARFAGHILRYRQANALMHTRGWSASYLGRWSDGFQSEATRVLGGGDWRASFPHEVADPESREPHVEHCVTGAVWFARRQGRQWAPVALTGVPPRVFSEAMRDIDLFVGVTSIGTDDAWAERREHRFFAYWTESGFGELTALSEVRRDALARILPKLRIADRCELGDRFLRVRGTLRTYRIHLGSGNILMEPNDAYLCVVPGRGSARIALPFDDDPTLSVILSKALLLAADDKIKDRTILSQMR